MSRFLQSVIHPILKTSTLLAVSILLAGCPSTDNSNQASNQPARTFQRGGDTDRALDTNVGAGHSASNGAVNVGGGMGGTSNAHTH